MDRDLASGRLDAIWIKRAKNGPMDPKPRALAVAGRGLKDNANQGGHRQVTLIEAEKWRRISAELGIEVDPITRRANLLVSGIDLSHCRGRTLKVGGCRLRMVGETRGCRRMEESVPGLLKAMGPEWRGGAYGQVLEGGEIEVGGAVAWDDEG